MTNPTPVNIFAPSIDNTILIYDPDASSYPLQYVTYSPFTASRPTCPDLVYYYAAFLSSTKSSLPTFIEFDAPNNQFIFNINSPDNVGTYPITMQGIIGNNKTAEVNFIIKV